MSQSRNHRPNRRGYILVLFALLLPVLLGFAALVIDLGLARVKLRQMQSATDTAALEGLRDEYRTGGERQSPRWFAAQTFYPEIDPDFESYATQQSVLEITEDSPPSGGVVQDPRERLWVPNMAANTDDAEQGDLEFISSPSGSQQFFARLRHSTHDIEQGIRHDSPPLPYLFGRATVRTTERPSEAIYRGISMRSVSVASTTRVLTMGPTVTINGETILGVEYVASVSDWDNAMVYGIQAGQEINRYTIGEVIPPTMVSSLATSPNGYVAIFDPNSTVANRIVGFGFIDANGPALNQHVVTRNASSQLLPTLDPSNQPSINEYGQLLNVNVNGFVQTTCLSPTPKAEFLEN